MKDNINNKAELVQLHDQLLDDAKKSDDPKVLMSIYHALVETTSCLDESKYQEANYLYIKKYIKHLIDCIDDEQFDYDNLCIDDIYYPFMYLDINKKYHLSKYVERLLLDKNYIENIIKAKEHTRLYKSKYLLSQIIKSKNPSTIINLIFVSSSINIKTILCTLLVFFTIPLIITIDAPFEWMQMYSFVKLKLCESYIINHIANVIALIFPNSLDVKLIPINIYGLLLLLAYKSFMFLIITNLIIVEISKRIQSQ